MTWPAALPGAALRSLRTVAGRRVLQVVLLVGGLFALGFLCGGQASAAEGIPTTTVTSGAAPADLLAKPPAEPEIHDYTAPPAALTDALPPSVDDKVLQPVGDLVDTVTEQLAETQAKLPPLPVTELPGLPELPELPTLPGLPALPGQTLPATTPQPKAPVADSPQDDAPGTRSDKAAAMAVFYGPPSVAGSPTTGAAAQTGRHPAVQGAHAPVQQAPGGDPGGALGNRPAADGGSPRHGDAYAVSLNHRTAVRLMAGAAVRADAFETRDRHRDIPVSPA